MGTLTSLKVDRAAPGTKICDGDGLWLIASPTGAKKWVLRYQLNKRAHEMGLGSYPEVQLAQAREKALDARRLARSGVDPIEERRKDRAIPTFAAMAEEVLANLPKEMNPKHRAQWVKSLWVEAARLHTKPVDAISTEDVLTALNPMWTAKTESASRLRGRIERVLNAAKAKGYRTGENPAAWRGHLENLLPKRGKLDRGHHAAMPYADVPALIARLRERDTVGAMALEFAILTAARAGEALGARWSEIDFEARVWTIPASRMKARLEHRVPLSDRALAILAKAQQLRTCEFVFPGRKRDGQSLSGVALQKQLKALGYEDITVHGFRSSFRDWAGNETHYPREVAEQALAHTVGNAVELAYRRGDALEKRRAMMDAWARHCEGPRRADVIELRGWR